MAMTINTNLVSLNAQRNLNGTSGSLSTSMQRLSSGLRVNSAKDDAAGLAIADGMNSQVRGLSVAARNANDAISLTQTAEGALGKVGDMLQRMRELAVQSANATNTTTNRAALDEEVQSLKSEIDRVANQTKFNDQVILDGSFTNKTFQVGADSGETISIAAIADANVAALGVSTRANVNSKAISSLSLGAVADGDIKIGTTSIGALGAAATTADRASQLTQAINAVSETTGVTAFIDTTSNNIQLNSKTSFNLLDTNAVGFSGYATATAVTAAATTGVTGVSVANSANAVAALDTIDSALESINTARAKMGAMQSRFQNAIETIGIQRENISAARGRIVDADFAEETANLSRSQILQQAGTAMLAQANQLPQQVLQLIR